MVKIEGVHCVEIRYFALSDFQKRIFLWKLNAEELCSWNLINLINHSYSLSIKNILTGTRHNCKHFTALSQLECLSSFSVSANFFAYPVNLLLKKCIGECFVQLVSWHFTPWFSKPPLLGFRLFFSSRVSVLESQSHVQWLFIPNIPGYLQWGSWNNSLNWRKVFKCLNFILQIWYLKYWCFCPWVFRLLWKPKLFFQTFIATRISLESLEYH